MQVSASTLKSTAACSSCRERKVKCSGASPCSNCFRHATFCSYPASRRGKRVRALHDRHGRHVSPSSALSRTTPNQNVIARTMTTSAIDQRNSSKQKTVRLSPSPRAAWEDVFPPNNPQHESYAISNNTVILPTPGHTQPSPSNATLMESVHREAAQPLYEEEMAPAQKAFWEHFGPWSWIAVCSPAGIRWVCERTQDNDFEATASGLTKAWSKRLKLTQEQARPQKSPEPDEVRAWEYVEAYFGQCYDALLGLIHRPTFEARLRMHFNRLNAGRLEGEDDPAWYALRNIVYAAGCRCVLARDTSASFVEAQSRAFCFFRNALSVYTELTFSYSGLTGVRVMAVMSFYAEGLGCPGLEYPLCANATQAAFSKGLHREPPRSCGLPTSETASRNWLWWAIYCLEKQLAFRSGRPSLIDDANITAKIPTDPVPGSTMDVIALTFLIRHARISAQISSCIMSAKAFKQSAADLARRVRNIETQLCDLHDSLPKDLRPTDYPNFGFPSAPQDIRAMYLHCAIYGSLMAVHMIFFYPWMSIRFGIDSEPDFQAQITASAETLAHAARQILYILRSIKTDVAVPSWLSFYYPMYAHINLFVHTLSYPHKDSALGDLALLDISAGHFGCIAHITSLTVAFHFPRDTAALAAKFVRATRATEMEEDTENSTPIPTSTGIQTPSNRGHRLNDSDFLSSNVVTEDPSFDIEAWNIFSQYGSGTTFDDFLA